MRVPARARSTNRLWTHLAFTAKSSSACPVDHLSLIAGGRVGHYEIDASSGASANSDRETKLTGYVSMVWDVIDDSSLYASYSSFHRPQTAVGTDGKLFKLKPRKVKQLEAGYKGGYLDEGLNTRTFYHLKEENAAASIAGDNSLYTSPDERIIRGVASEA